MSGWKRKGFWTNHGWDMIFSHKNLGCCLIGHLHICNFDFRTPIFILYEMYRKLKMLEYKHLLKSPIFPFDSRLWKGQFGNGKGMEKIHSRNSGTGREWKKSIPEIREREGNEKNPFPKFGKGIRGLHSWEWPGTGTGMGIIFYSLFWIFFFLGLPWKFFHWLCAPKSFPDSPTCIVTPKKNWDKNSM